MISSVRPDPHASIHGSNTDEQAVWENDTNAKRCWSSRQPVSVPDESDWIIFGDEHRAPAGTEMQACADLNRDKNT